MARLNSGSRINATLPSDGQPGFVEMRRRHDVSVSRRVKSAVTEFLKNCRRGDILIAFDLLPASLRPLA